MSKKTVGIVLMVVGAVAVIVSLGADAFGIGSEAGFGRNQTLGAAACAIIVVVGAWLWRGLPQSRPQGDTAEPGPDRSVPAAPRAPQQSPSSRGRKPGTAERLSGAVRKSTARGSRQRGKK